MRKTAFCKTCGFILLLRWLYFCLKVMEKTLSPYVFLIAVNPESVIRICTDYVLMSSRLPTVSSKA